MSQSKVINFVVKNFNNQESKEWNTSKFEILTNENALLHSHALPSHNGIVFEHFPFALIYSLPTFSLCCLWCKSKAEIITLTMTKFILVRLSFGEAHIC